MSVALQALRAAQDRHMDICRLLGVDKGELFDILAYLDGTRDTLPELTPAYSFEEVA
jgi:hypothetical protein